MMKWHVRMGANSRMTFEPCWVPWGNEHVAPGAAQQTCRSLAQTEILLTTEERKRTNTAPTRARARNRAKDGFHNRKPDALKFSSTDHSLCQTAVHMIPFSTLVFTACTLHSPSAPITLNFPTLDQCCVFIIRRLKYPATPTNQQEDTCTRKHEKRPEACVRQHGNNSLLRVPQSPRSSTTVQYLRVSTYSGMRLSSEVAT